VDDLPGVRAARTEGVLSRPTVWPTLARSRAVRGLARPGLHVEAEMHHVAVAHDVVLAFQPHFSLLLRARLAAVGDEVLVGDRLGTDEAALEVAVDHARGLRRGRPGPHGPGAHFLDAGGEEGQQPEQLVGCAD